MKSKWFTIHLYRTKFVILSRCRKGRFEKPRTSHVYNSFCPVGLSYPQTHFSAVGSCWEITWRLLKTHMLKSQPQVPQNVTGFKRWAAKGALGKNGIIFTDPDPWTCVLKQRHKMLTKKVIWRLWKKASIHKPRREASGETRRACSALHSEPPASWDLSKSYQIVLFALYTSSCFAMLASPDNPMERQQNQPFRKVFMRASSTAGNRMETVSYCLCSITWGWAWGVWWQLGDEAGGQLFGRAFA